MVKTTNIVQTKLIDDIEAFVSPLISIRKIDLIVDFESLDLSGTLKNIVFEANVSDLNNALSRLSQVYGGKLVYLVERYIDHMRPEAGINFKLGIPVKAQMSLVKQLNQLLKAVLRAHLKFPETHDGKQSPFDTGLIGAQLRSLFDVITDSDSNGKPRTLIFNFTKKIYEPVDRNFGAWWTVVCCRVMGLRSNQNIEHDVLLAMSRLAKRVDFNKANTSFVGLANGDLDLSSFEIVTPTSTHFVTYRLPLAPNVANTEITPTWRHFLNTQWADNQDTIKFLIQWSALQLFPKNVGVFCIMYNTGQAGKSTWQNAIKAMLGSENVASVTADKFSKNFGPAMLLNSDDSMKLSNLVDESPRSFDMSFLKKVADEDAALTIDIKNDKAVTVPLNIKMTFATNSLEIGNNSFEHNFGTFRKVRLLHYPNIISHPDPHIGQKMIDELDDMGGVFINCLKEMHDAGSFVPIESESMIDWKQNWFDSLHSKDSNVIDDFIQARVQFGVEATTDRKMIYASFEEFVSTSDSNVGKFNRPQIFWSEFERIVGQHGVSAARKSNGRRLYDGLSISFESDL